MSNKYINNSDIYQVNAERDISVILNRFNSDYIFECIDNGLQSKNSSQFIINNPNLIRSIENNFNMLKTEYPDDIDNIMGTREDLYNEVINYICPKFNLSFNDNDNVDLYSAAYILYEFLVSNYLNYLTQFYARFIFKERNSLYKSLNLDKLKKSTNINYSKKVIKDPVISSILINTSYILDQLTAFNFDFETIINTVYDDYNTRSFITSIFYDKGTFYDFYKNDIHNEFIRPNIITNIRLAIQDEIMSYELMDKSFMRGE